MLVRFILFLLVFYLIYFLIKNLFTKPFKEGYRQKNGSGKGSGSTYQRRNQGDVTITYDPSRHKKGDRSAGEYVDYEEVKEKD